MKKLLVLVVAFMLVLGVAAMAYALEETISGTVGLQLKGENITPSSFDSTPASVGTGVVIKWGLTHEFSDIYSAGITLKIEDPAKAANDSTTVVSLDGDVWIKLNYDPLTITAYANDREVAAGNDLATWGGDAASAWKGSYCLPGNEGVQADYKLGDLTLTGWINGSDRYLFKALYSTDALTIGAAYQAAPETGDINDRDDMGVWASMKIGDTMNAGVEYNQRTGWQEATGMLAKFGYAGEALSVNAKYFSNTDGFINFCGWSLDGKFMDAYQAIQRSYFTGSAVSVDASYKISDAFSVNGAVMDILDTLDPGIADTDMLSYKVGAGYAMTDAIKLDAYYEARGLANKIDVMLTDTLAEGLTASLELYSWTPLAGGDATLGYIAQLKATF